MELSHDIERLLRQRYYHQGETWPDLVDRVVNHVCIDEPDWFKRTAREHILHRVWLPNSPCLVNANTKVNGLFACFVVGPSEDTLENHVEVLGDIAMVAKRGGGCGFTGTNIRPEGSPVAGSVHGSAYGPNNWAIKVSQYLDMITQGHFRKMALMYTMRSDHPDLDKFIELKQTNDERFAYNFNQSVMATDNWMTRAANAPNGEHRQLRRLAQNAWNNGDPGLLFYDTINNNTPYSKCDCPPIEVTNPCQPGFATVLTPDGIKTFDEIEEGSLIWSGKEWTTVLRKWTTGRKPVYRYLSSFGEFVGTENHQVLDHGHKVEASLADSFDASAGPYERSVKWDSQTVMDGLVLGDGSVHKASNNLVFLLIGENDKDYFDSEIAGLLLEDRSIGFASGGQAFTIKTNIESSELPLVHLRRVPERYLRGNQITIKSFLRGLFSANGSVVANGYRVTLKQTSHDLIRDVQKMLSAVGIRSYVTINKPSVIEWDNGTYESKQSYDLNITQDRYKFLSDIGFIQNYKNERVLGANGNRPCSGTLQSVDYLGDYSVYDITVDNEEHVYWTGGVIVSNCGEQPLPYYASCNLGSINLANELFFNPDGSYDFAKLSYVAGIVTRFLDDVGIRNVFPNNKFKEWYDNHRPVGVGVMGFADALLRLGLAYGKQESLEFLERVMQTIYNSAVKMSELLGEERGVPDHCDKVRRRNITVVSIAPTGSIGFIAGCSHSIEPVFSPIYQRTDEKGETYLFTHPDRNKSFFVSSINDDESKTPTWKEHINVQAAAQRWTDSAVSKTVNMPFEATVDDIYNSMIYAWDSGCKGITVYRDGSRQFQVLENVKEEQQELIDCPDGVCVI